MRATIPRADAGASFVRTSTSIASVSGGWAGCLLSVGAMLLLFSSR
ncbi:hypothetical protein [Burkholderia sp. AU32262]|nr:hypothetical protein [Burkholderia sp. AU32262]MCA8241860.1 hypothetical protein [Burkholderia sp. AU32262]